MALSPFDSLSINYMLGIDGQMEGITPYAHYLPDIRPGAYGRIVGHYSPGKNIGSTSHARHPATPMIGNQAPAPRTTPMIPGGVQQTGFS